MNTVTIGLPRELKQGERRVALTPSGVASVIARGHRLLAERGVGEHLGFSDAAYTRAGATLVDDASTLWEADVVIKVKEPQPIEQSYLREDLVLFSYLHLAAEAQVTQALVAAGVHACAFETLRDDSGLPLLAPMSEIAGRAAAIIGASQLAAVNGGSGRLIGGSAGVPPAKAVVVGLGVAGSMAARGLRGLDAYVTGVDIDLRRLYDLRLAGIVDATLISEPDLIGELVPDADLVIGAALVPGARAPVVVTEEQVASMRPGSVVVDLAIDQGGCVATSRPTTLAEPTYLAHDVLHYCVTNVPGQFPRTASEALSAAVTPRLLRLVDVLAAGADLSPTTRGIEGTLNVSAGRIVHPGVAKAFPDLPGILTDDLEQT